METRPLTPALAAEDLKRRILSGESVPLDELKTFILFSNNSLQEQRKSREKPTDVEFF